MSDQPASTSCSGVHQAAPAKGVMHGTATKVISSLILAAILGAGGLLLAHESRIAVAENTVESIEGDVKEIKGDVKKLLERR